MTVAGVGSGAAFASGRTGPIRGTGAAGAVKGRYIVVLKDTKASKATVHTDGLSLTKRFGGTLRHEYSHGVHGFSAAMTEAQAKRLAADGRVAYVEQDRRVKLDGSQSDPPSWGLDRIDQTFLPLSGSYTYPTDGSGVTVYVIDSGIHIANTDFGGRASYGHNFDSTSSDPNADDCDGHGTHVAGTIGGTRYGVAKGVNLVAVRVTDCSGGGYVSDIIDGVDWVTATAIAAGTPAVANMSLGTDWGTFSTALDTEIGSSIAAGITYTVAAGNDGKDACQESPADVADAITVGATNKADFRADFSNTGTCVDVFAPGVGITSDWNTGDTATATIGGTSMAAPHVAGAAALLLSANPTWTPAQVATAIKDGAVPMAVHDAGTGSPNLLLNVNGTRTSTTISLRSHANGMYVSAASGGGAPLIANRYVPGGWETFDVVDAGGGWSALRSHANGRYVTAESAGAKPLIANRTAVGSWEMFMISWNADGSVNLLAHANGKYVTADAAGAKALIANRASAGSWESFDEAGPVAVISLRAEVNGKYVTADSAGTRPLIANRSAIGSWEQFDVVDMGNGWLALRSHADYKFVTAESAGTRPLIANRAAVGSWELFQFVSYGGDGSISVEAHANGRIVTADSAGAAPLIANRTAVGSWEVFELV